MRNQPLRGRTRDSSWQWLVIGVVLGLGCASVTCLGSYALGLLKLNVGVAEAFTPTPPPTYTAYPTYTAAPTLTFAPTSAQAAPPTPAGPAPDNTLFVQTQVPAVPTNFVIAQQTAATAALGLTLPVLPTQPSQGTELAPATLPPITSAAVTPGGGPAQITLPPIASGAREELLNGATDLIPLTGGRFYLGTSPAEAKVAVDDCTSRDKGNCDLSMTEDSIVRHYVTLDSYQMEKYEVSVDQYIAFLNSLSTSYKTACDGPCLAVVDKDHQGSPIKLDGVVYKAATELLRDRPVTYITWSGAKAYCQAIGRRLPTEAEWERAARRKLDGDNMSIYPWGDAWDATLANSSRPPLNGPLEVTKYPDGASAEGVLNLAGNVAEWVNDWYGKNYYNTLNQNKPKGPPSGTDKVVRGGSFATVPLFLRSVHRQNFPPNTVNPTIGFRCAQDGSGSANNNNGGTSNGGGNQPVAEPTKQGTLTP